MSLRDAFSKTLKPIKPVQMEINRRVPKASKFVRKVSKAFVAGKTRDPFSLMPKASMRPPALPRLPKPSI